MAREKEAFGFYFSAHPVSQFKAVADSHGAKSHGELLQSGHIPEGTRRHAKMAAMIEGVRWRESRRGKRFVMVECSDATGQFSASCFEDGVAEELAEWGKEAACLLLDVEMDMPAGEDVPRFAIRSAKPLASLSNVTRLKMAMDVESESAILQLAKLIGPLQGGRCELAIRAPTSIGKSADITLGRKFMLDAEIKARVEAIDGISNVELAPLGIPHLSVVR
jgi:DNA polymerase-3 subunit alpha